MMHLINRNDKYVQYGATILNNPLNEEKFGEYRKKRTFSKDNNYNYIDYDDGKYNINNSNIYEPPPTKKIKINNNNNQIHDLDLDLDLNIQRIPKKDPIL